MPGEVEPGEVEPQPSLPREHRGVVPAGLWVDRERQIAGWGDRVLPLSAGEVAVLTALLEADGRVVARRELARRCGLYGSGRRCDMMLVRLRRVLGQGAIRNVRRRGWMLMPPVGGMGGQAAAGRAGPG